MSKHGKFFLVIVLLLAAFDLASQQRVEPSQMRISAASLWQTAIGDRIRGTPHLQTGSIVIVDRKSVV